MISRTEIAWPLDVRTAALIAFIASVLALLNPIWKALVMVKADTSRDVSGWWPLPIMLFTLFATAIIPTFLFALYRNEGTLQIGRRLRQLSFAAAAVQLFLVVPALQIELRDPDFVIRGGFADTTTRTINHVVSLLGPISNVTLLLLLLSLAFCRIDDRENGATYSRLLDQVTKIAVIVYGAVVAICIFRFFLIPWFYSEGRDAALTNGHDPIPVSAFVKDFMETLVAQACVFVAPYVVFRSMPSAPDEAEGVPAATS